jgi:Spherulation-specific family 4
MANSISAHPNLNFVVVLNPNSGPGVDWQPDECYAAEILRLNAQANVRAVGYVRIDYCRRPLHQVSEDIAKYAGWSQHAGLGVQGIFFDETPNLYSPHVAGYLDAVNQTVKKSTGIGGRRLVRQLRSNVSKRKGFFKPCLFVIGQD